MDMDIIDMIEYACIAISYLAANINNRSTLIMSGIEELLQIIIIGKEITNNNNNTSTTVVDKNGVVAIGLVFPESTRKRASFCLNVIDS